MHETRSGSAVTNLAEHWETYLAGRLDVDIQMLEQAPVPESPDNVDSDQINAP